MPPGFAALADADRARLHFSDAKITAATGKAFSEAHLHNVAGLAYATQPNFQVALAYLFYPLSKLEQGTIDLSLADPALFQKALALGAWPPWSKFWMRAWRR